MAKYPSRKKVDYEFKKGHTIILAAYCSEIFGSAALDLLLVIDTEFLT